MKLGDAGFGRDQEAPPDQGTDIPKHYAKLIKFCHSSSLPENRPELPNYTPRFLPLSQLVAALKTEGAY